MGGWLGGGGEGEVSCVRCLGRWETELDKIPQSIEL